MSEKRHLPRFNGPRFAHLCRRCGSFVGDRTKHWGPMAWLGEKALLDHLNHDLRESLSMSEAYCRDLEAATDRVEALRSRWDERGKRGDEQAARCEQMLRHALYGADYFGIKPGVHVDRAPDPRPQQIIDDPAGWFARARERRAAEVADDMGKRLAKAARSRAANKRRLYP